MVGTHQPTGLTLFLGKGGEGGPTTYFTCIQSDYLSTIQYTTAVVGQSMSDTSPFISPQNFEFELFDTTSLGASDKVEALSKNNQFKIEFTHINIHLQP